MTLFVRNKVTRSFPQVIHAPDESLIWRQLVSLFNAVPIYSPVLSGNLTILTWNNFRSSPLEECLLRRKVPFVTTGKEVTVWNNLQKFILNLKVLHDYDTKYFMGLDAHDVLMLGDPAEIVRRFEKLDCDLLFNAETYFYPDFSIDYYQENKAFQTSIARGKYRYLNSGSWIGRREFCTAFFEECVGIRVWEMFDCTGYLKLYNCDQSVVHGVFKKHYPRVKLDYDCKVFFNMAKIDPGEVSVLRWL